MVGSREALALHVLLCCLCRGFTTIPCSGHVWIEPAQVVRMGTNVSITCLSTLDCPSTELSIFLNYSRSEGTPQRLNSSAIQLQLHNFQTPYMSVTCFARCTNSKMHRLVCGTDICAGYPPDPPSNLTCSILEHSGNLSCTWDTGRATHLHTHYSLHLRSVGRPQGAEDAEEDAEEDAVFPAGSLVPLSTLHNRTCYWAWVQARNRLGTARSAPRRLNLRNLVVPTLPLVSSAETMETSPLTTTIHWKRQTLLENVHCEERHKATGALAWHVEVWDGAAQHGTGSRHNLQSNTRYVFQVRCRLSSDHSPWSPWSTPFLYTTPEAAPAAAPEVWRRLGAAFPNGSREVTVLIKPLPPQDARGRILGYAVTSESPRGSQLLCNTSSTACSILVPPGTHVLHITAHNSRGASSPASIPLGWGDSSQEEFPAPVAVEVKPENQSGVVVSWQPPGRSGTAPLWFLVEWDSPSQYSQEQRYRWRRVPNQETQVHIQDEAVAGGHSNVLVYAIYPHGVSTPSSSQAPSEDQFLTSTSSNISHDDDVGVFLGLGVTVVILSVVLLVLMFKKSARKRINSTLVSLLPKWLFEDFPHMENSSVVKSLQGKNDLVSNGETHEPFLDTSDPPVTEIEEVHMEYKNVASRKKPSREVPGDGQRPGRVVPACTPTPQQISGYKPQVSDGSPLGYVAANIYQTQPPTLLPEPEMNIFFRDYTSPIPQLWDRDGEGPHVCLLEKINLILNNSRSGQSHLFSPAQGGHGSFLENPWGPTLSSDVQEQTLVPDELVSCLRAMNKESVDMKTCSQQSMGRLF